MQQFITNSPQETKKLARKLASGFKGGEILCLSGDLGAGKTTFTQGLLEALGAEGPYTSPTFNIIKEYRIENLEFGMGTKNKESINYGFKIQNSKFKILHVYHIDAYRINADDLRELGFLDFAGKPNTVTIIEWPENIKDIIPDNALWLKFKWIDENKRKITFCQK
jgi:tRNA threonylcarbamoyladenosine biosynthesis protein TsaE